MTAPVVFVDIETTGLDPDRHEVWEVGLIVPEPESAAGRYTTYSWQLPVQNLGRADARALEIGRFHERRLPKGELTWVTDFAYEFTRLTWGKHLAGAVVSFDEERLRKLIRGYHECPGWHYHLVDVEALAAGKLGVQPPWNSNDLSLAVGIDPADFDRHSALGDARWAKAIYDAVMVQ